MAVLAGNEVSLVVGADGQPVAVQVGIHVWREIVAALEDAEDVGVARRALTALQAAGGDPERAGWLNLEALEQAWAVDDDH
jgi:predicted regulator of Ras-like GTPase activity (Roadblock/LC7/MglB family)